MSTALQSIDIDKHLRSLSLLCPNGWHVSIVDPFGELVTSATDPLAPLACQVANAHRDSIKDEHGIIVVDKQAYSYQLLCLLSDNDKAYGFVVVAALANHPAAPNLAQVKLITQMLTAECALSDELDLMAGELADRYEELNLVYSTSDQVEAQNDDVQLLDDIVGNVVDYLQSQFSVLSIPDKGIWLTASVPSIDLVSLEPLMHQVEPLILDWLHEHQQPLVVNQPADADAYNPPKELAFRFLATPVRDAQNKIIGAFGMGKALTTPPISNSDKNLVAAMADKVSKVIQYSYDNLTGLSTQAKFERNLNAALSSLTKHKAHSLIYVSNTEEQFIQDHYGSNIANKVLAYVSTQLHQLGRDTDISTRLDDGDLALVLINCAAEVALRKANELVVQMQSKPLVFGTHRVRLRIAIGLVKLDLASNLNATDAISQGRIANRIARENTEEPVHFFVPDNQLVLQQRSSAHTLACIHSALIEHGFELYAQEIAGLNTTETEPHFEFLLRLHDSEGKLISPVEFIPLAEKHNLMTQIDLWVVVNALACIKHSNILQRYPNTIGSINLSGQSLSGERFLSQIIDAVRNSGVLPHNICFEITETAAIGDLTKAQEFIKSLRDLGCKFALDDFGAGLSSFTYLRSLALDYVKIDGSFVRDILTDTVAEKMVKSIHEVGTAMGLQTIAEYVENEAIATQLKDLGIHFVQGYGIGKPVPVDKWLTQYTASDVASG